jgi:phosphatidylserine decarboxylase
LVLAGGFVVSWPREAGLLNRRAFVSLGRKQRMRRQLSTPHAINSEGYPFILLFILLSGGLFFLALPLGWLGVLLTIWCVYFFRDPPRRLPAIEGAVVAPADGKVLPLRRVVPPPEMGLGEGPCLKVSVFMNIFNVHVNRIPIGGRIVELHYMKGKFINASFDKASDGNERQMITIEAENGRRFGLVQVAGLIARRIVCELEAGQSVDAGQRFGMIRFGSRVDLYLPDGLDPMVSEGQSTIAGETLMGFNSKSGNPPPDQVGD